MGKIKPGEPCTGRTDVRFDYVDKLPCGVPAVEKQPTSLFPFPPPVGPAEATYYFPIPQENNRVTGVFFPAGFSFPDTIDVILYFHGFKKDEFTVDKTINEYWNGQDTSSHKALRLREDVNTSGKRVVLIAPTLGAKPGSTSTGDMGIFANPTGGDDYLAEVRRWIRKYVPQYASPPAPRKPLPTDGPPIRKLVLAGHSGAGVILLTQAKGMKTPICEVWAFDATYSELGFSEKKPDQKPFHRDIIKEWLALARMHSKDTKYYFYHHRPWDGKDKDGKAIYDDMPHEAMDLGAAAKKEGLSNVIVDETAPEKKQSGMDQHFATVYKNFLTRVRSASFFS
jgi:hypothetical protein